MMPEASSSEDLPSADRAPSRALGPDQGEETACRRLVLGFILAFALARVALAYAFGFGIDEAYTVVISRRLDLSYFDHPPLHQWIAHFTGRLIGEGLSMRLPFIALFAGTGWLIYLLTRKLFSARAGVWAVFGLNASAFFFASAGSWIVPDGPLLFALAAAAYVFAKLFFEEADARAVWRRWLAGGFWLGVAALSKYNAVFFALGLVAFIALSPRQRRWFAHPAPYLAALICLVVLSPVLVWNAQNDWVSFVFQGVRGAPHGQWRPLQVVSMILGQIVWVTPWIFVPLAAALVAAMRLGRKDSRRFYLVCLALPPIIFFTLTPLWGSRGQPHWPMPGWLFVYPLLGAWLVERAARGFNLRRWAIWSAALLAALGVAIGSQAATGWVERLGLLPASVTDPTREALNWDALKASPLLGGEGGKLPGFVLSNHWSEAGKMALALGAKMPVIVSPDDPRGIAFLQDPAAYVGRDAVIIVPINQISTLPDVFRAYFEELGPPQKVSIGRGGMDELDLALFPAHRLTQPLPLPYPRRAAADPSPKAPL
jgi:Dolichyl-phosphate-mannose-protein mannosyltransferase